jgi:hypothetical protein
MDLSKLIGPDVEAEIRADARKRFWMELEGFLLEEIHPGAPALACIAAALRQKLFDRFHGLVEDGNVLRWLSASPRLRVSEPGPSDVEQGGEPTRNRPDVPVSGVFRVLTFGVNDFGDWALLFDKPGANSNDARKEADHHLEQYSGLGFDVAVAIVDPQGNSTFRCYGFVPTDIQERIWAAIDNKRGLREAMPEGDTPARLLRSMRAILDGMADEQTRQSEDLHQAADLIERHCPAATEEKGRG